VIDSGLNETEVESVQAHFGELQKAYIAKHGLTNLEVLGEEHMIRAPLTLGDRIFSEIALNPNVLALVSQLIQSRFYLSQQNGVINPASQEYSQGRWHRDLPFQHWVISKPIAINALYCVDDFTEQNGATWVVPGSHKHAAFPTDSYIEENSVQLEAKAGQFLVLDCMLFHSGGQNTTQVARRGLNHVYSVPLLAPQISIPHSMESSWMNEEQMELLGFKYQIPLSVEEFLAARTPSSRLS